MGFVQEGECSSGTLSAFYICGSAIQVKRTAASRMRRSARDCRAEKLCAWVAASARSISVVLYVPRYSTSRIARLTPIKVIGSQGVRVPIMGPGGGDISSSNFQTVSSARLGPPHSWNRRTNARHMGSLPLSVSARLGWQGGCCSPPSRRARNQRKGSTG